MRKVAEIEGVPQYEHDRPYIMGNYGCSCHPFLSWPDCQKAHKQKLKTGLVVRNRCLGTIGVVHEDTDAQGFCLVKYGDLPRDIHSEHVAQLAPHSIQLAFFKPQ